MRTRSSILVAAALLGASAGSAHAAPALRVQVDQHGDFLLIGNTLGYECAAGTPNPVVGTIAANACSNQGNTNVNDTAPDLFWQADGPMNGQAQATAAVTAAQARSTAILTVPNGATVTHAFLYWAAESPNNTPTTTVTIDRVGGFSQQVTALQTFVPNTNNAYQAVADITALVQVNGTGAYRVSGINPAPFLNVNDSAGFGGWAMVVLYQRAADPLRNLAIFDGLDVVTNGGNQTATLSGFLVPATGFTGKLGVIAYEGDNGINGDSLFFGGGAALSDAQNPVNNFFNGTRSNLGAAVSVAGDLPQLTGTAQSMAGIDLDVVDVTAKLTAGQTSAMVQATSSGDVYYLGAFITSVSTFKPDFSTSTKTGTDVNGGSLVAGDTLQYTINVVNTGNDTSINTVLTDALPMGVTYVPGSLSIASGPNSGAKSDMTGDDQGDYNAATRTVTVRLGVGANATNGGTLAINATTSVTFQVKVDAGFSGNLANQANISAGGRARRADRHHAHRRQRPRGRQPADHGRRRSVHLERRVRRAHAGLRHRVLAQGLRGVRRRQRLRRHHERQGLHARAHLRRRLPQHRQRLPRARAVHVDGRDHRPVRRVPRGRRLRRHDERQGLRHHDLQVRGRLPRRRRQRLPRRGRVHVDGHVDRPVRRLLAGQRLRRERQRQGLRHEHEHVRRRVQGHDRGHLPDGPAVHVDGHEHRPVRRLPLGRQLRQRDQRQGLRHEHEHVHRRLPQHGQRLPDGPAVHVDGCDHRPVRGVPDGQRVRRRGERQGLRSHERQVHRRLPRHRQRLPGGPPVHVGDGDHRPVRGLPEGQRLR
ncbi:MAG: DUF11 domain-containing protein [Minicystis sp.]